MGRTKLGLGVGHIILGLKVGHIIPGLEVGQIIHGLGAGHIKPDQGVGMWIEKTITKNPRSLRWDSNPNYLHLKLAPRLDDYLYPH